MCSHVTVFGWPSQLPIVWNRYHVRYPRNPFDANPLVLSCQISVDCTPSNFCGWKTMHFPKWSNLNRNTKRLLYSDWFLRIVCINPIPQNISVASLIKTSGKFSRSRGPFISVDTTVRFKDRLVMMTPYGVINLQTVDWWPTAISGSDAQVH